MSDQPDTEPRGALFGVFVIVIGVFTLLTVGSIRSTAFGENNDPGPRALPQALAVCLILGGAAEVASNWIKRRRASAQTVSGAAAPVSADRANVLNATILLGSLIVYIAALPWLGFTLSTLLFAGGMMWRLKIGWVLNLCVSAGLVVAVHILFVLLFRVQLPTGVLGLPF